MSEDSMKWLCVTLVVLAAILAACTGHNDVAGTVIGGLVICAFLGVL